MPEQGKDVSNTLDKAYPPAQADDTKLKAMLAELENKMKELEKENNSLKEKLAEIEKEQVKKLAEQVADTKISRGLLEESKRAEATAELSKLSFSVLELLQKELSQVKVKLSENPTPLVTLAQEPAQLSPAQLKQNEVDEMRQKLFGHKEDPYEFYKKNGRF